MIMKTYDDIERILIDAKTINNRVDELAVQINADYAHVDELLLVCILKGSLYFYGGPIPETKCASCGGFHGFEHIWSGI